MAAKKDKARVNYSEDEKIKIVENVCELYATTSATLASCCESAGTNERLFRYWLGASVRFSDSYKKAKERSTEIYWDRLREKAQTGLERLVQGESRTEKRTESGIASNGALVTKDVEMEVVVMPNATSVIFALKGEFPERFRENVNLSGEVSTGKNPLLSLSKEDQDLFLLKLQQANGANK